MSQQVHKVRVRDSLEPRREPYWAAPLAPGRFLGYRKIDAERGSWVARARTEDGRQQYNALGALTSTFDYDAAAQAARDWFSSLDAGVVAKGSYTVEDACKDYVEDRRKVKGDRCADDAEWRFKKYIYGTAFARTELVKLRTPAIKKWRDELGITHAGQNRTMTALRAALNLAVDNRQVVASQRIEWELVKQFQKADGRREIYLDRQQRRALLEAAQGAVRDLMEAVMLTGARPGELARATRGQFDARQKSLKLIGKTGPRTVPLSPAALALFERVSKDKLPTAPLLSRDDGQPWPGAEWTDEVRAAAAAAVLKDEAGKTLKDEKGKEVKLPAGVCLYTLRHSFITQAITDGLSALDVARVTGTSLAMIDKHYGHLVHASVAERLARVQMV